MESIYRKYMLIHMKLSVSCGFSSSVNNLFLPSRGIIQVGVLGFQLTYITAPVVACNIYVSNKIEKKSGENTVEKEGCLF